MVVCGPVPTFPTFPGSSAPPLGIRAATSINFNWNWFTSSTSSSWLLHSSSDTPAVVPNPQELVCPYTRVTPEICASRWHFAAGFALAFLDNFFCGRIRVTICAEIWMVSASRVVPTTKIGVDDVDGSSDLAVEMGVFQSTVSPRFTTMFILISSIFKIKIMKIKLACIL